MAKYASIAILLVPQVVFGSFDITEIMYDAPGADAGFEWIEVLNTSSGSIDLALWKFRESGTAHKITPFGTGSSLVPSGAYAVIADNPDKFRSAFPSFSGLLFDSAFSLSNEGEPLEIVDPEGGIAKSVSYSAQSAAGDGNTLNLSSSGWVARTPSPGAALLSTTITNPTTGSSGTSGKINMLRPVAVNTKSENSKSKEPGLTLPSDIYTFAGESVVLPLETIGYHPKEVRYLWNFGDGTTAIGETQKHTYRAPGDYLVNVRTTGLSTSLEARGVVHVLPVTVSIAAIEYGGEWFAEIRNDSTSEIELGGWAIAHRGSQIVLPPHSIVLAESSMIIPLRGIVSANDTIVIFDEKGKQIATSKDAPRENKEMSSVDSNEESEEETGEGALNDTEQAFLKSEADRLALGQAPLGSAVSPSALGAQTAEAAPLSRSSQGAAAILALGEGEPGGSEPTSDVGSFFERSKGLLALILLFGGASAFLLYRSGMVAANTELAHGFEVVEEE